MVKCKRLMKNPYWPLDIPQGEKQRFAIPSDK